MAGQGYSQDFYESGYDMDGVQQQQAPPPDQAGWVPPTAPTQAQWGEATAQQQGYYPPVASYGAQQSYGQQGRITLTYNSQIGQMSFLFRAHLYCVSIVSLNGRQCV